MGEVVRGEQSTKCDWHVWGMFRAAFVKLNIEAFRYIAFQKRSFVFGYSFPGKSLQLVQVNVRSVQHRGD
jgi:hypothetical protein